MKTFTAIIERDSQTNLYMGYVPGFPGAHSQGDTLDELQQNLSDVIEMLNRFLRQSLLVHNRLYFTSSIPLS